MSSNTPITIHRKDYTAPSYWINTVEMGFDLDPSATKVATRITMQRNHTSPNKDVELLGDGVKLVALRMNGKTLSKGAKGYTIEDGKLCIANAPDNITLEIETVIHPEKNTTMMGLYVSNGIFGELHLAQHAHIVDALHRAATGGAHHVGRKFLIAEHGEAFFQ